MQRAGGRRRAARDDTFAVTPAIILIARVDAYLITYWMMAFWGDVLVGEAAPSAHTLGPKK
jgi:hypothetical protein